MGGSVAALGPAETLPDNPASVSAAQAVAACRAVYAAREAIVSGTTLDAAREGLRRARAIEAYLSGREAKAEAKRAARILETAVGEALGPAVVGANQYGEGFRASDASLSKQDAHRFRLMAEHRALWWPKLEQAGLSRAQVLADIAALTRGDHQPSGETCTTSDLHKLIERGARFGAIYADPPWVYDNQGTRAATGNHYGGLTVDELCALPVRELAAPDAHLHLWTTNAFLFDCPRIFDAWGFEFRSSFVWVKPQMGIGNYWRNSHEFLLTAIRGNAKRFSDRTLKSWLDCDRSRHSEKPFIVRDYIRRASPGPYLEMFARTPAEGWTVWGNEIDRGLLFHHMDAAE